MKLALVTLDKMPSMNAPPLGLGYLATYLEHKLGFADTAIVDGGIDDVHGRLQKIQPDLIGISATSFTYGNAIKAARKIRTYTKAQIMVGGAHISAMPESLHEVFDFAVLGEAEETLRELVTAFSNAGPLLKGRLSETRGILYRNQAGNPVQAPARPLIEDLDSIPYPQLHRFSSRYTHPREDLAVATIARCAPLLTARGCPYKCAFCSTAKFWETYRSHSADYVVENIRYLIEDRGAQIINVLDDMFVTNTKRLGEIRDKLRQTGLLGKAKFTSSARSNHINDEICEIISDLGVASLNFGFETGSERVLKYLKRGSTTVQKHHNAIKTCKRHGIKVFGSLMLGSPGETLEEMEETLVFIDQARQEKADYLWTLSATPFPATLFWEEAKKRGRVSNQIDWETDPLASFYDFDAPLLLDVDKRLFHDLHRRAQKKLRGMRIRLVWEFWKKNPFGAIALGLTKLPYYLNRFYHYMFRF